MSGRAVSFNSNIRCTFLPSDSRRHAFGAGLSGGAGARGVGLGRAARSPTPESTIPASAGRGRRRPAVTAPTVEAGSRAGLKPNGETPAENVQRVVIYINKKNSLAAFARKLLFCRRCHRPWSSASVTRTTRSVRVSMSTRPLPTTITAFTRNLADDLEWLMQNQQDGDSDMLDSPLILNIIVSLLQHAPQEQASSVAKRLAFILQRKWWDAYRRGGDAGRAFDQRCQAFVRAGGIGPLVTMLSGAETAEGAVRALDAIDQSGVAAANARDAIFEAGGIPPLVALLSWALGDGIDEGRRVSAQAASLLVHLAQASEGAAAAIVAAGGITTLMALLSPTALNATSRQTGAYALGGLASCTDSVRVEIVRAGAITPLVALLSKDAHLVTASAAGNSLRKLAGTCEDTKDAIAIAGAIAPLVARLRNGREGAAGRLLSTLAAGSEHRSRSVLTAVQGQQGLASIEPYANLCSSLQPSVTATLDAALAGTDRSALTEAIALATLLGRHFDQAKLKDACDWRDQLDAADADARRARRESVGLSVAPPEEFICPITLEPMADPVVASDGHSYERSAIADVLKGPNKKSPLTREVLSDALVPNRALRRRIEEHDKELDALAEKLEARMTQATTEAVAQAAAKTAEAQAARAEAETLRRQLETQREQLQEYGAAAGSNAAGKRRAASEEPESEASSSGATKASDGGVAKRRRQDGR